MNSLTTTSRVLSVALACLTGGCFNSFQKVPVCPISDAGATAVQPPQLIPDWAAIKLEDDNTFSFPVVVATAVECLTGTLTASVTTSRGTIGSVTAGTPIDVVLTQTEVGDDLGRVSGEFLLTLPVGQSRRVRIDVRIGDWSGAFAIDPIPPTSETDSGTGD